MVAASGTHRRQPSGGLKPTEAIGTPVAAHNHITNVEAAQISNPPRSQSMCRAWVASTFDCRVKARHTMQDGHGQRAAYRGGQHRCGGLGGPLLAAAQTVEGTFSNVPHGPLFDEQVALRPMRSGAPVHRRSSVADCSTTERTEFVAVIHERGSPDACPQRTSQRHLSATPVQPQRRHRRRADEGQRRCVATVDASRCRRRVRPQHRARKTPARVGGRRPFDEDERRRPPGLWLRSAWASAPRAAKCA